MGESWKGHGWVADASGLLEFAQVSRKGRRKKSEASEASGSFPSFFVFGGLRETPNGNNFPSRPRTRQHAGNNSSQGFGNLLLLYITSLSCCCCRHSSAVVYNV